MKKHGLIFVLSLLLALQGCAGSLNNRKESTNDNPNITLNLVTPFGNGDGYQEVYTDLVKNFEETTGIIINDNSQMSSEAWKQGVLNSFHNNEEPDVLFFFNGADSEAFIQEGKVIDLETIRSHRPNYAMHITFGVMNTMRANDGLNYCVPVSGFWEGLFINEDLFEEHNIKIPVTMDELFDAVTAFRQAGVIPISVNLKDTPHYWFEYLLYNYTGPSNHNFLAQQNSGSLPEAWVKGLTAFQALYKAEAFPDNLDSVTDDMCIDLFNNKEAAMMLSGSWSTGSIKDVSNVKVVPVPAEDSTIRRATDIIGGFSMGFYITKKAWDSDKRDAALDFVEAMISEEALLKFNKGGGASPAPLPEQSNTTPLVLSARSYVSEATAFASAVQDSFTKEAREYLFSQIIYIAKEEIGIDTVLSEFNSLN